MLGDIDLGVVRLYGTGFQSGGIQQVVDVPQQQLGIADDELQIGTCRLVRSDRFQQLARGLQDQHQRGAKLVADVGEELTLEIVELLGTRIQIGQFGIGLLEVSARLGYFMGAGEDLLFRLLGRDA